MSILSWLLLALVAGLALSVFVLAFNFGLWLLFWLNDCLMGLVDNVCYAIKKAAKGANHEH